MPSLRDSGMPSLHDIDVDVGPNTLLDSLRRALDGTGPALRPTRTPTPSPEQVPPGIALVIATSGSSGEPKQTMLSRQALVASADATHAVLGGPGRWLLALPVDHIAGVQVLVRSIRSSTDPVTMASPGRFAPTAFAEAAARALDGAGPAYTALVPTQLARVLADPVATTALARFDAVLVGGAGTPADLAEAARASGVRIVRTYGMSETAGGCVYDGLPLPVTRMRLGDDGRVELGGATLADGYLGEQSRTEAAFTVARDGSRWFRTDDEGRLGPDGRLDVLRRLDTLIVTGGVKVDPDAVRRALLGLEEVRDALVVPVPDPQWGQAVGALVVWQDPAAPLTLRELRSRLAAVVPGPARPQLLAGVAALPRTGLGKPDGSTATSILASGGRIRG